MGSFWRAWNGIHTEIKRNKNKEQIKARNRFACGKMRCSFRLQTVRKLFCWNVYYVQNGPEERDASQHNTALSKFGEHVWFGNSFCKVSSWLFSYRCLLTITAFGPWMNLSKTNTQVIFTVAACSLSPSVSDLIKIQCLLQGTDHMAQKCLRLYGCLLPEEKVTSSVVPVSLL